MKIKLTWDTAKGELDTKTMKLISLPGRANRNEVDSDLCIADGWNFCIARIHMGNLESSNALCKEIVRRFNEFPEDLKQ